MSLCVPYSKLFPYSKLERASAVVFAIAFGEGIFPVLSEKISIPKLQISTGNPYVLRSYVASSGAMNGLYKSFWLKLAGNFLVGKILALSKLTSLN